MKARKPNRAGTPRPARPREQKAGVKGKSTRRQPPARRGPASEAARRLRETERRAEAEPPAELDAATLAERMTALEGILRWQGLDDAPATSLEELYPLWNVRSEREAWLHLAIHLEELCACRLEHGMHVLLAHAHALRVLRAQ